MRDMTLLCVWHDSFLLNWWWWQNLIDFNTRWLQWLQVNLYKTINSFVKSYLERHPLTKNIKTKTSKNSITNQFISFDYRCSRQSITVVVMTHPISPSPYKRVPSAVVVPVTSIAARCKYNIIWQHAIASMFTKTSFIHLSIEPQKNHSKTSEKCCFRRTTLCLQYSHVQE